MSRLIVKNLPNGITEQRLKALFEQKGLVTDVNLKFAKNGVFRKFAFVGYQTEDEAKTAREYFDASFIDTSKIQVEDCRGLGDGEKPRAWSQHSADSSRFQGAHQQTTGLKKLGKSHAVPGEEKKQSRQSEDKFSQMMRNPLLSEEEKALLEKSRNDPDFVEFFQVKQNKSAWNNDDLQSFTGSAAGKPAVKPEIVADSDNGKGKEDFNKMKNAVKLKHLPKGVSKALIREFFKPLNPSRVHLPKKAKDIAFVQFASREEVHKAVVYDKKSITGQTVSVLKCHDEKGSDDVDLPEIAPEISTDPALEAEPLGDSGRLFIRNLPFTCTADDLETLFGKFGPLTEIKLPIDFMTQRCKGYGIITFMMPEHAVKALGLDGKDFRGRVIHVMPAQPKREEEIPPPPVGGSSSAFKKEKKAKLKDSSQNANTWNSLFLGTNAVMDVIAERYKVSKAQILESDNSKQSAAVRVALGETQIVNETRDFLLANGVKLDAFGMANSVRSKTVILVKNLPAGTQSDELVKLFTEYGTISRLVLPPAGVTAIVEMIDPTAAKKAFRGLAYFKFGSLPLFLEWAPQDVLQEKLQSSPAATAKVSDTKSSEELEVSPDEKELGVAPAEKALSPKKEEMSTEAPPGSTLFVKNLNFSTVDDSLYNFFSSAGPVKSATVARKIGPKGETLSMGYGFVEFKNLNAAREAIRTLQHASLDGHTLELKVSERAVRPLAENTRKTAAGQEQPSAKIMVRNIPFQASEKEIRDIFRVFGEIKSARLPRKMGETGSHRGFCFIEYHSKKDAKRAFDALCQSTHLYSRRLVLEWAQVDEQNVEVLRHKVAEHFHDDAASRKKLKKRHLYDELDQTLLMEADDE